MKQKADKWVDEVMNSLEGSQRATPPVGLLDKIEAQLSVPGAKRIPLRSLRWLAAAAIALLFVNLFSLRMTQANQPTTADGATISEDSDRIVPTYNLYE